MTELFDALMLHAHVGSIQCFIKCSNLSLNLADKIKYLRQ